MDNKDKLDIINRVSQRTGCELIQCLYALRENNWDEEEAINFIRGNGSQLDDFLRYNRYE